MGTQCFWFSKEVPNKNLGKLCFFFLVSDSENGYMFLEMKTKQKKNECLEEPNRASAFHMTKIWFLSW